MKMKRLASMLLVAVMSMMLVVGCSSGNSSAQSASTDTVAPSTMSDGTLSVGDDPVTLDVMTWQYNDNEVEALNQTIELYRQKYPNVTVNLVTVQDYLTEYKLAFDANEGADVVYVDDTTQVLLERYNYLMDITTFVEDYGWKDLTRNGIMDYQNARHEGQYFSAAQNNNPRVMWYNTDIFKELDLEIPQTLDELDAVCEAVKDAGYVPFDADPITLLWMIEELVLDYAPYEDVKDWYYLENTSDAVRDAWLQAAQKVSEWLDKGYFRPEILSLDTTGAFTQFAGGTSAMFYCSANISSYFGAYVDTYTVGAFQFPTRSAGETKVTVSGAHGAWAVNSSIDEKKLGAAIEFINMFYTKEVNDIWVSTGYFSSLDFDITDAVVDDAYRAANAAVENTQIGFFLDNAATGLLDKMLTLNQALLLGEVTPEQYASQLEQDYESLKAEQLA